MRLFVVNEKTGVGKFYPRFDDREVVYNPFTECVQRLESIDSIKMKEKQCEDNLLRSFCAVLVPHCIHMLGSVFGITSLL